MSDSQFSNPSLSHPSVSPQTMQFPNLVFCLRSSKGRNRGAGMSRTWRRRVRSLLMPQQVRHEDSPGLCSQELLIPRLKQMLLGAVADVVFIRRSLA